MTVKTWDVKTGGLSKIFSGHTGPVLSASFSPDGKRILTGSLDDTIRIWDVKTGRQLSSMEANDSISVSFSPDGRQILAGGNKTAVIRDAGTGEVVKTLKGHLDSISSSSFSPDGTLVITGSLDKTAKIWDVKTGREILSLKTREKTVVCFSPCGRRVLTGGRDGIIIIWDVQSGRKLLSFNGGVGELYSVSFSPDGNHLAATGREHRAIVQSGPSHAAY